MRTRRPRSAAVARSAFAGFCFPPDVIVLAVRWYLRFALSYRDLEELLAERGVEVDHVTIYRWVRRFTPLLAEAAGPAAMPWVVAGESTRPMGRSSAAGATSTERSTSSARSSTCSSPHGATRPLPAGASSGRSARRRSARWRS
jgi:hypothetical protein